MADPAAKAMDVQEKFEFYMLSLTFTLLALSVQSASFGNNLASDILELIGWCLLLISGVIGIFRLEMVPVALRYYAVQSEAEVDEADLKKVESKIASRKYIWFFIAGLAFVILARSIPALSKII